MMINDRIKFKIPSPDVKEGEYKFYPLIRLGRVVPFGYEQDPNDKDVLLPIPRELILLEQAKEHLKHYSLRDVATWLSHHSGRKLSHVGLRARVMAEQDREKEYVTARKLLAKLKKAYVKAKRLESQRLGLREPLDEDIDAELFTSLTKET